MQHTPQDLSKAAELFRLFADPTRLKILCALQEGEICVSDIATRVEQTESAVSHQLRLLRAERLVASRKEGRAVYYRLLDAHISSLMMNALDHVAEENESET